MNALYALIEKHPRWGFWMCCDRLRLTGRRWIREYNGERPHDSLGRIPPAVFRRRVENAGNSSFEMSH